MRIQNRTLDQMKGKAESLWQALIEAGSEDEKVPLREKYRFAFETYRRQCLIADEGAGGSARTARPSNPGEYPNPFEFHDYREFLLAWLKSAQASPKSLKAFAEKSGVKPEEFARVLKRWESMSIQTFRKIIREMNLSEIELEYVEALHCLSDTASKEMRDAAIKRLQRFSEFKKAHPPEYEAWRYLTHWYYVAIREMSRLAGFRPSAEWIEKRLRFPVPIAEIKRALGFLEGASFFRVTEGRVEPSLKRVSCAGGVFKIALGQFHREMLSIASDSIRVVSSNKRVLLGHTMAISKDNYDKVRRILEEAHEKIANLDPGERSSDDVYHVELVAVPITRGSETP